MARAIAPNPAIRAIPDGKEGDTVRLGVTFDESGARYDRLTYAWSGITGLDDSSAASPTWTRQDVNADTEFSVRVEVTAHGDGRNADSGTTDSRSDTEPATVLQVPDAVAPTGEVRRISVGVVTTVVNALERAMIELRADISGGTYDRLEFAWTLVDFREGHRGTVFPGVFDSAARSEPVVTLPSVDGNTSVYLRCVVTAYGDNGNARRGTSHIRTLTDAHFTILQRPQAQAPALTLTGVENVLSGHRLNLGLDLEGDQYDTYDFRWQVWQGSPGNPGTNIAGQTLDNPRSRNPVFTAPVVPSNTVYTVEATMNVRGDDHRADRDSPLSSRTVHQAFTVEPLPDALGPNLVRIDAIPRGDMRTRVQLGVGFYSGGGTWDRDTYAWTCRRTIGSTEHNHDSSLSDTTIRRPVWTRPDVDEDDESVPFVFACVATFHGDGVEAKDGTSSRRTAEFTVNALVDYVNIMDRAGGVGVYVTDEYGNEIVIDAMFPSPAE